MDAYRNEAQNRSFNALLRSLPTREVIIGEHADGTQIIAEVPMAVAR